MTLKTKIGISNQLIEIAIAEKLKRMGYVVAGRPLFISKSNTSRYNLETFINGGEVDIEVTPVRPTKPEPPKKRGRSPKKKARLQ